MHCRRAAKIRPLVRGQFKTSNYQISNAKWPSLVVSHVNEGHALLWFLLHPQETMKCDWYHSFQRWERIMSPAIISLNSISELKELCQISLT